MIVHKAHSEGFMCDALDPEVFVYDWQYAEASLQSAVQDVSEELDDSCTFQNNWWRCCSRQGEVRE